MALAMAGFYLGIKLVGTLHPHEGIIPSHVKQLASEMVRDGVQKDPIIIDRDSATVLDGMHRLAAFRELKVENAVCCSVAYGSSAVTLGRWARVYTLKDEEALDAPLAHFGRLTKTTLADAYASLQRREAGLAVLTPNAAYLAGAKARLEEVLGEVGAFDRHAEGRGWERSFVSEDDVEVSLQEGRRFAVLVRRLTKEDVITAARTGRLFPCKTSMHLIDPRPVAVNYPISELNEATTATLRERLRGREERIVPAGSVYQGRRYKERLLLLN